MERKTILLAALLAAGSLSFITGGAAEAKSVANTPAPAGLTYEQAGEIARAEVGGGEVWEIDLDYKRGRLVYEVEIRHDGLEYEVDVEADDGQVVGVKSEKFGGRGNSVPAADPMPFSRAQDVALAEAGGGAVTDIDLDREHGRLVYDIEVHNGWQEHEIKIDAVTGEIVRHKIDQD